MIKKITDKVKKLNEKFQQIITKKNVKRIFQFLPNNLYLFILFIVLFILLSFKILNNDTILYKMYNSSYTGEIINKSVEQKINVKNLKQSDSNIGIMFGTYMRTNNAIYKFDLYENNKIIYTKKFNAKSIEDNKFKYFSSKKIKFNATSKYKFVITPLKAKAGNAIAVAKSDKGELVYILHKKSDFYTFVFIVSGIFLLLFFFVNYLINNNKIKKEKSYAILMLIYIIPLLFLYPPFQTPDEPYHFYKSMKISQISSKHSLNTNMSEKSITVPQNISCLDYANIQKSDNIVSESDIMKCIKKTKNGKILSYRFKPEGIISYIPSALGVKIADLMTNSPLLIFYLGRIFSFLVCFSIIIFALKQIPNHKRILLLVVMIPVFVQQLISFSYDAMLNSLSILVIAYLMKFYSSSEIENKDLIIYTIASLIILDIKKPYFLLCLPILFLKGEKFGKEKKCKIKKLLLMILFIVLWYMLFKFISNYGVDVNNVTNSGGERGNALSSLFDIKYLILIIYNTLKVNGTLYLESLIGNLGWLIFKLDYVHIYAYILVLILSVLSEKETMDVKNRVVNILIILALISGIFLAMYLYWTPHGRIVVEGVQGRYFLAPLLLFMISCMPKKEKINLSNKFIYEFVNLSMLSYIVTILVQFY